MTDIYLSDAWKNGELRSQLHQAQAAVTEYISEVAELTKENRELRQQRDALLAAAKMASPVFNNPEETYFADYVKAAKATDDAIALCETKVTSCQRLSS